MTLEEFDNIQVGDRFYYQWGQPPNGEEDYPVIVENRTENKLRLKLENEDTDVHLIRYKQVFIDGQVTLIPINKYKIKQLPYEAGII